MLDKNCYAILHAVRLEGGLAKAEDLVHLALEIRRKDYSASELHQAVLDCLAQGWIKVLTKEDCLFDTARWKGDVKEAYNTYRKEAYNAYREGSIDFTQAGWEVFAEFQGKYGGIDRLLSSAATYLWNTPGQVSLLATSEESLLAEIEQVKNGTDDLYFESLSKDRTITKIVGPYAIGLWWVTRFYQAPQGYRADIFYEPAD
jgi:hypothetical protein